MKKRSGTITINETQFVCLLSDIPVGGWFQVVKGGNPDGWLCGRVLEPPKDNIIQDSIKLDDMVYVQTFDVSLGSPIIQNTVISKDSSVWRVTLTSMNLVFNRI